MKLFDKFVHGVIDRRAFLNGAAKYTVGGVTASMLLDSLSPKFAEAQQVRPNDSRIRTRMVNYPSPRGHGTVKGYLAEPANATGKLPVVIVVHENRGLNPHIEDIARRIALDNYIAFAPDALTVSGGYPGDEDKAREAFSKLDQAKAREDFIASAAFVKTLPQGTGRYGVVGFCYGGGIANIMATQLPDLAVAVPFYGIAPPVAEVPKIRARLLVHYAAVDERINAAWPPYEAALKAANVRYETFFYPGTQHGFNNDTTPRFDTNAAALAWQRTMAAFASGLRS